MASATSESLQAAQQQANPAEKSEEPKRFVTSFGNLTPKEILDWEKMLGKRLLRL